MIPNPMDPRDLLLCICAQDRKCQMHEEHSVVLYFEAHVTIEPVFDEDLEEFKTLCKPHRFHVADLLMKKREQDTLERSRFDTFATTRGQSFPAIYLATRSLVRDAQRAGFVVWRYKIENTLVDERIK